MEANKHSEARQRIVETASRLFYTQGYNATGINQIIAEAEVAKASLYQHFPSKEDLLVEYLNVTAINTNKALKAAIDKFETSKEKVLAAFDFLIQFSESVKCEGCNFLKISAETIKSNEKISDLIKAQKNRVRDLFRTVLENEGKAELTNEIYVLFDGALVTSRVYNDIWPITVARQTASRIL